MVDGELAYLAGFFDGEGCILITKSKTRLGNPNYKLRVCITQVNPSPLRKFQERFRGLIQYRPTNNANHRSRHTWEANNNQAYQTLIALKPYLDVKHHEAEIAIEFCEKLIANFQGKKKTADDILLCESYKSRLAAMKRSNFENQAQNLGMRKHGEET